MKRVPEKRLVATVVLCGALVGSVTAGPKCEVDTFSEKRSCIYGTGTLGLKGVGNQVITSDGQMIYVRMFTKYGSPIETQAMLFRIDSRRTVKLSATNLTRPTVSCSGMGACMWMWNVAVPLSGAVLAELASANELVTAIEGRDGQRSNSEKMNRGGSLFAKLLADIREHEPEVLESSKSEAFLQKSDVLLPYDAPEASAVPRETEGAEGAAPRAAIIAPVPLTPAQVAPASVPAAQPHSWWDKQKRGE